MSGVERMAWSGTCDECQTVYHLYPNEEAEASDQEEISTTWPREGDCMVIDCDGSVEWNGNDRLQDVIAARLI